jgi:hypothetical protein
VCRHSDRDRVDHRHVEWQCSGGRCVAAALHDECFENFDLDSGALLVLTCELLRATTRHHR